MKRILSILLALALFAGVFALTACGGGTETSESASESASESSSESTYESEVGLSANVTVTLSLAGTLAFCLETISVSDRNGDGKLDIDETLYAAHETFFEGGAAAGYASAESEYGFGITKLWGDDSGAFGYYVNNAGAMGLGGAVTEGDHVYAYVYTDTVTWSDVYSYFDQSEATAAVGGEVTLVLTYAGYDASWMPVTLPVAGATITLNGVETAFVTDGDGRVTISFEDAGVYLVSAVCEGMVLVPSVCAVTVW